MTVTLNENSRFPILISVKKDKYTLCCQLEIGILTVIWIRHLFIENDHVNLHIQSDSD